MHQIWSCSNVPMHQVVSCIPLDPLQFCLIIYKVTTQKIRHVANFSCSKYKCIKVTVQSLSKVLPVDKQDTFTENNSTVHNYHCFRLLKNVCQRGTAILILLHKVLNQPITSSHYILIGWHIPTTVMDADQSKITIQVSHRRMWAIVKYKYLPHKWTYSVNL